MSVPSKGIDDGAPLSGADLAATLNAVNDAITVQRPDGTLVWANDAAARMLAYDSPQAVLSAPPSELLSRFNVLDEEGKPFPLEQLPGRLVLNGLPAPETLLSWRCGDSEAIHWSLVRATPVTGPDGEIRFAVNVFRDDTARQSAIQSLQRSEGRLVLLASASRALLRASLDPVEIAQSLTEVCVPGLGDLCAVWESNPSGETRKIAIRSVEPGQLADPDETPADVVAALSGESTLSVGERHDRFSRVAVPIPGPDGPLGAILLVRHRSRARFVHEDLELIEEVGRRAGGKIENANLYAERSRAAAILSQSLVPAEIQEVPGLDVFGFVRPAASGVGGDFYDVVSLADGRSLLLIADVCGKGVEAAALTAMARYTLRTLAQYHASPAELLAAVNEALVDQLPDGRFCSLACGAFGPSPKGIRVTVAVAGHPKPFLIRKSGAIETCGKTGLPLGIFYRLDLIEEDVVLEAGDAFLLVTDGCVGEGGVWDPVLSEALSQASPGSAKELAKLVETVAMGVQPDHPDDIAALVARFPGD